MAHDSLARALAEPFTGEDVDAPNEELAEVRPLVTPSEIPTGNSGPDSDAEEGAQRGPRACAREDNTPPENTEGERLGVGVPKIWPVEEPADESQDAPETAVGTVAQVVSEAAAEALEEAAEDAEEVAPRPTLRERAGKAAQPVLKRFESGELRPPRWWTHSPTPARDVWLRSKEAPWTLDEGWTRTAGKAYTVLVAVPVTVMCAVVAWTFEHVSRLVMVLVLIGLIAASIWLVPILTQIS